MMRSVERVSSRSSDPIPVLEPNRWCVMAFQVCQWTVHVGMSKKPIYQGISAKEMRAAADLVRAPRSEWPRIAQGITEHMVPAALSWFNR